MNENPLTSMAEQCTAALHSHIPLKALASRIILHVHTASHRIATEPNPMSCLHSMQTAIHIYIYIYPPRPVWPQGV